MSTSMSSTLMTMAQVAAALPLHGMLPFAQLFLLLNQFSCQLILIPSFIHPSHSSLQYIHRCRHGVDPSASSKEEHTGGCARCT